MSRLTLALLALTVAFICRPCRRAADYLATTGTYPNQTDETRAHTARVAAGLHAQCPAGSSCCCQHRPQERTP